MSSAPAKSAPLPDSQRRRGIAALVLAGATALMCQLTDAAGSWPSFTAKYVISTGGLKTGKATVSLSCGDDGDYLYRQESEPTGLASLFAPNRAVQTSRWRFGPDGRVRPLEYEASQRGGDDDANVHLQFDWVAHRVRNTGAGDHWTLHMPDDTLDPLSMTLALMDGIERGHTRFDYPVAVRGRIKHYRFSKVGDEKVKLPFGSFDAVRVARTDEDEDKSWIWSAPALHYLPVRYLKRKSGGVEIEMRLEQVRFSPLPDNATCSAQPDGAASGS